MSLIVRGLGSILSTEEVIFTQPPLLIYGDPSEAYLYSVEVEPQLQIRDNIQAPIIIGKTMFSE